MARTEYGKQDDGRWKPSFMTTSEIRRELAGGSDRNEALRKELGKRIGEKGSDHEQPRDAKRSDARTTREPSDTGTR